MSDTTPAAPPPSAPGLVREGLELRADGTVGIWIDGVEWRLRRPRLGEFRQLSDSLQDRVDIINDAVDALRLLREELEGPPPPKNEDGTEPPRPELSPEHTAKLRAQTRDLGRDREHLSGEWWVEAMTTLSTRDAPEVADLPAWMADVDDTIVLLAHWRSVPSLSGAR